MKDATAWHMAKRSHGEQAREHRAARSGRSVYEQSSRNTRRRRNRTLARDEMQKRSYSEQSIGTWEKRFFLTAREPVAVID